MTTVSLYEHLNRLAQNLNEIRHDENTLITRSIKLMREGKEKEATALLAFDNTVEIINRLFDTAWGCWREISHACHEEEERCLNK